MVSGTPKTPESWRIFCAVELPEEVRKRLLQHIGALRASVPDSQASWAKETSVHLTIKFLGEIPASSADRVSRAASRAVATIAPFEIELRGSGVFPIRGSPKVLWIGVEDHGRQLARLQDNLELECEREGFPRESRPFHPHLTVARLRKTRDARMLATTHRELYFAPTAIELSELLVIRSELNSAGSKYTVLSRHRQHR